MVVSGITLKGVVRVNDTLLLGPDPVGHFISTSIRSIHRKRMLVKEVRGGQTASFALKKVRNITSITLIDIIIFQFICVNMIKFDMLFTDMVEIINEVGRLFGVANISR